MPDRTKSIPLWFILTLVVLVASQIVRLYQTTDIGWLLCDYAGRLAALFILVAIPAARGIAFQVQPLRTRWWETGLWFITLFLFPIFVAPRIAHFINGLFPHTRIGSYPNPHGWLLFIDATAGLALVAYQEEIFFRRCSRALLSACWGDGAPTIIATSLLFAAYHWTTGLGNIVSNFFFGLIAILCLKRIGALWPIVLAHYLADLSIFYLLPNL